MTPGIYRVKFSSVQQGYGEGLAVFKDGTINGGDDGYLYVGHYTRDGKIVNAQIKINRWSQNAVSVFGNIQTFDLVLRGEIADNLSEFTVSGFAAQLPNLNIIVQGQRLADAR